ncbi:uncharacterized protein ACA1_354340 [Acanthamoeba castellanii str. Neff]|uniref:Uncharacterized protein n=1 Tax=Acanthamoeba castellanii (strain ATCC 30010 / Neff) TaxID=1257118 RepID=L8GFN6_ACACF|nr:uncharacterized protein ACA1_354340 [Acanthamoeba castellanii str. Neff]ELR10996.1 hypothetical protein ACA1_354340 [Acanthamoeba castellanii str. Neff]
MAKAATEILYPAHHRKEGEAVGITRWYTHKAIKVVNYVKHCLMQGDSYWGALGYVPKSLHKALDYFSVVDKKDVHKESTIAARDLVDKGMG